MLTGQYPVRHGARDNSVYFLSDEAVTLAEVLKDNGYKTGASVASIVLSHRFGVEQGFDFFGEGKLVVEDGQEKQDGVVERDGREVADEAIRFIESRLSDVGPTSPFFFWVHFYDPHEPYVMHDGLDPGFAFTAYESEVRYTDLQVGRLLSCISGTGLAENTVVVIASDHGEGLGQHHERSHSMLVYETTISVPLIYAGPGTAKGRVIDKSLGRLVDIMPTVLDLAGIEPPRDVVFDGESSARLLDPGMDSAKIKGAQSAYFETMGPCTYDWSHLDGITTLEWKYIRGPTDELYHIPNDPHEFNDVIDEHRDEAERLCRAAAAVAAITPETGGVCDMSGRQSELFGALGYLSLDVRARKMSADKPHPRDMILILDTLTTARSLYNAGRFKDAIPLFEKCVSLSRGSAVFHDLLGRTYLKLGDYKNAGAFFSKALSIHPEMVDTRLTLGIVLVNTGSYEEAEREFRDVIKASPGLFAAYGYLANLLRMLDRPGDELRVLEALFENTTPISDERAKPLRFRMDQLRKEIRTD